MKIATWNVNSIRTRLAHVGAWLETNPVDILCLQETKVVEPDFPRAPFTDLGYSTYVSGQKSYNGVALISRTPLEHVSTGFAPVLGDGVLDLDEQKRVITGVAGPLRVVNLYVPNGSAIDSDKYHHKLRWLSVLRDYLQALLHPSDGSSVACLICGDFNIALEDRDIYNPEGRENLVMASEQERQALRAILDLGFADTFRKFTEEAGHFSWWDYRAGAFRQNKGWRIDHHYVTPDLYEKTIACTIDPAPRQLSQPSDHTPVVVELSL